MGKYNTFHAITFLNSLFGKLKLSLLHTLILYYNNVELEWLSTFSTSSFQAPRNSRSLEMVTVERGYNDKNIYIYIYIIIYIKNIKNILDYNDTLDYNV
jgi:hypothetical protein